jgi:hypothetical protein
VLRGKAEAASIFRNTSDVGLERELICSIFLMFYRKKSVVVPEGIKKQHLLSSVRHESMAAMWVKATIITRHATEAIR